MIKIGINDVFTSSFCSMKIVLIFVDNEVEDKSNVDDLLTSWASFVDF